MSALLMIVKQLWETVPYPTERLSGQVFIVTGANVGLGFEAAKHLVRLDAAKVILAVRNQAAGEEAAKAIESATQRKGATEVWPLDLAKYESVRAFIRRMDGLPRLDGVSLNAALAPLSWSFAEDNETGITVNVISTMLLAVAGIPILEKSAKQYGTVPRLSIVSSGIANLAKFPERHSNDIIGALNDRSKADIMERYPVTKLLEIFALRELARRYSEVTDGKPMVTLNILSPGFCHSSLSRQMSGLMAVRMRIMKALFAYTSETGARTLVHGVTAGKETYGHFLSTCQIADSHIARWTREEEGKNVQAKLWDELTERWEKIRPGSTAFLAKS